MIAKRIFILLAILSALSGCWVDEAKEPAKKDLHIIADYLSAEDSSIIRDFGRNRRVEITFSVLSPDAILKRVRTHRYNAEIDILICEDATLLKQLQELNVFRTIRNPALFSRLERQFNNHHHHWIPVSHDPLVVTAPKDTADNCPTIDFRNWHTNDGLQAGIAFNKYRSDYFSLISKSPRLNRMKDNPKPETLSNERIYPLSQLVELENGTDSLNTNKLRTCRYFLIDNQRYITRINSAAIYRYGRNSAAAEQFLSFYSGNAYQVASGRNQLPTGKNIQPNWYIRALSIK